MRINSYSSYSTKETEEFAFELAKKARAKEVYCLCGDLGVGKTAFSKGFAKGLGISEHVTSPTFTLINEYDGDFKLYHFDVYRIECVDEMYETGFEDYFYGEGVCLVEWANLIEELIPPEAIWIDISKDLDKDENYRLIEIREGLK